MNISPSIVSEPNEKSALKSNSNRAPEIPRKIPKTLKTVILFFKIIADAISTIIGLEVIIIPALIGVVMFNP